MNDTELEDRVRTTLRAVADATPVATTSHARRRWPIVTAVATAAAAAIAIVAFVGTRDVDRAVVTDDPSPGPAGVSSPLPAGFDVGTANPVFSAAGEPDDVAEAYLRDRFPDYPAPGVTREPAVTEAGVVRVRWSTSGETEGRLSSGDVFLRLVDARWSVVAATTDDLDLSDLTYDGERLTGTIRSTADDSFVVDLLDWRGERVHEEGGAPSSFGPDTGSITIDRRYRLMPIVARVTHVGGTVLAIAEVRLDPPPLPAHTDVESCTTELTSDAKEPTPDIVHRLCVASLDGAVIARGGGSLTWELVASDEPSGHWVTLRSLDQIGTFRIQVGPDDTDALYTQMGPCCSTADSVVVVAALHSDADRLRVTLSDGHVFEAGVSKDTTTGVQYAVVLVPLDQLPADATAEIVIDLADGSTRHVEGSFDLAILGG